MCVCGASCSLLFFPHSYFLSHQEVLEFGVLVLPLRSLTTRT